MRKFNQCKSNYFQVTYINKLSLSSNRFCSQIQKYRAHALLKHKPYLHTAHHLWPWTSWIRDTHVHAAYHRSLLTLLDAGCTKHPCAFFCARKKHVSATSHSWISRTNGTYFLSLTNRCQYGMQSYTIPYAWRTYFLRVAKAHERFFAAAVKQP